MQVRTLGLSVHFWNLTVHNNSLTDLALWQGALSCWYRQLSSPNRSSTVDSMQQVRMSLYPSVFRFPCSITRGPSPFHEKTSKFHCWHYTCWQVSFSRHSPNPNPPIRLPHGIVWFITTFPVVHCPVALLFKPLRAALSVHKQNVWFIGSCSLMEPHSS
jgi:hypothetical protein